MSRARNDRLAHALAATAAAASFATTVAIAWVLLRMAWTPLFFAPQGGIWALLAGTFMMCAVALGVALPLGGLIAIALGEYTPRRLRLVWKPFLELTAAVPGIVHAYFAITFVTPLLQRLIPGVRPMNALSAGIALGAMVLPFIATLCEDAISAVPRSLREAAYALGASRWKTLVQVVLPAAAPSMGIAVLLGVSRAAGETLIVALVCGSGVSGVFDPRGPVQTMSGLLAQLALRGLSPGSLDERAFFAVAMCFFALTLGTNTLVARLRKVARLQRSW